MSIINEQSHTSWLDKPVSNWIPKLSVEKVIIIIILLLALVSRFYDVGARVMSHDEVNHVVPSWDLAQGRGYRQDPITHGPLQFHLIAATYFMFGDSDFTSRVPAALFSFATVAFVLLFYRRYLGKWGHLLGGLLFLISPYLLFYGRYTRNEALIGLFAVMILYATMRYLDVGDNFSLVMLTVANALNFTAKETAYIYMAQLLLFLAILFLSEVINEHWKSKRSRQAFIIFTSIAILLLLIGIGLAYAHTKENPVSETGEPLVATATTTIQMLSNLSVLLAIVTGIVAIFLLFKGLGQDRIRHLRSFDLLILNGSITIPLLTAFPIVMLGSILGTNWKATDYSSMGIVRIGITLVIMILISLIIGLWWNRKAWIKYNVIFWSIFVVFYTTFFTNGQGFFTGIVGSLGYWLEQQAVSRGSQPIYYYALLQIPFYEYLAALGTLLAITIGIRHVREASLPISVPLKPVEDEILVASELGDEELFPSEPVVEEKIQRIPVLFLFIFWSLTSLVAYSLAGEKMPWLTVHIAVPLLLTAAWGLNKLIESIPWHKIKENKSWISLLLLPVFIASLSATLGSFLHNPAPFQGKTLVELQATSTFVFAFITLVASAYGIFHYLRNWEPKESYRLILLAFFAFLAVLTTRHAFMATYINYDYPKEFLVYAHAARGPKEILAQVEEISRRTVGDKDIAIAYDNDSLYPFWWYFRDYPNKIWYTDQPTRDLLNSPVILASSTNYSKIDALTKDEYIYYEFKRLWWPMQDYYYLNWERIQYALTNPGMRSALFNIWLNRDYTEYAELKGREDLTLSNWSPSQALRMYIRKDIVAKIWNYGSLPAIVTEPKVDPYESKMISLIPNKIIGSPGELPGQFNYPHGMAIAGDGSIFVADSRNHRIQHFTPDGTLINTWGQFADSMIETAPGGTFNEPWGIAIGPDGYLYVTDTWNHRVQKFSQDGTFIQTWGYFGTAETPDGFWGPRGIVVDQDGHVFIADTGNKRIAVFDSEGNFITQFGEAGFDVGQFDEPVGLALGLNGEVYVADTWNQRIQVFTPNENHTQYTYAFSWEVAGWYGQSLDNKPFLASDSNGRIYVTDPEGYRVLVFEADGTFITGWGDYSPQADGFGLPAAIAVDTQNSIWVSDAGNNLLLNFSLP